MSKLNLKSLAVAAGVSAAAAGGAAADERICDVRTSHWSATPSDSGQSVSRNGLGALFSNISVRPANGGTLTYLPTDLLQGERYSARVDAVGIDNTHGSAKVYNGEIIEIDVDDQALAATIGFTDLDPGQSVAVSVNGAPYQSVQVTETDGLGQAFITVSNPDEVLIAPGRGSSFGVSSVTFNREYCRSVGGGDNDGPGQPDGPDGPDGPGNGGGFGGTGDAFLLPREESPNAAPEPSAFA